jgi:hypothetical protein
VKPKSGVGAATSLDVDEPEVVPKKDLRIDAAEKCSACSAGLLR